MTNRNIAKAIVMAESGSDAGKGFKPEYTSSHSPMRRAEENGYAIKGEYILRALKLIASAKRSAFSFYVIMEDNGFLITYFETVVRKETIQVSFHVPTWDKQYDLISKYVGKGKPTKWNQIIGGSVDACHLLAEHYEL